MNPNVLTLLPARVRFWIYVAYGVLVILAGAAHVAYASLERNDPAPLIVAASVLQYLSIPVLALAAVNVVRSPDEPALGTSLAEREASEPEQP